VSASHGIPDAEPAWSDNWTHGAGTLHLEILHVASRSVWLSQEAVTDATFDALVPPEGFVKTGVGASVADVAYFRRSPGADRDGPVETLEVGGLRLARVARAAGAPEPGLPGVRVFPVDKHHVLLFRAGRMLEIMDLGDGFDYVPLVVGARGAITGDRPSANPRPRALPEGWSVRTLRLERDLVVELPNPTRVAFFAGGDSFQGPVRLEL
jgi:hypothetical protein